MIKYFLALFLLYCSITSCYAQQWIPSYSGPNIMQNGAGLVGGSYSYTYVYPYQYQAYIYYTPNINIVYNYAPPVVYYEDRYINRRVWVPNIHRYYQNHNHYYNYRYFYNY